MNLTSLSCPLHCLIGTLFLGGLLFLYLYWKYAIVFLPVDDDVKGNFLPDENKERFWADLSFMVLLVPGICVFYC